MLLCWRWMATFSNIFHKHIISRNGDCNWCYAAYCRSTTLFPRIFVPQRPTHPSSKQNNLIWSSRPKSSLARRWRRHMNTNMCISVKLAGWWYIRENLSNASPVLGWGTGISGKVNDSRRTPRMTLIVTTGLQLSIHPHTRFYVWMYILSWSQPHVYIRRNHFWLWDIQCDLRDFENDRTSSVFFS